MGKKVVCGPIVEAEGARTSAVTNEAKYEQKVTIPNYAYCTNLGDD